MPKLEKGSYVRSPVSGRRYRIGNTIGSGGYGQAFHAFDLGKRKNVCLKYSFDQNSWHRESYFGELLRGHPRVIQLYDSFPMMPGAWGRGRIRYCLALELAEHGTVADYLVQGGKPWPEERAKREIVALLVLLDQLHGGSATHRDITPFNIFVCKNGTLKLGDFGIARHQLAGKPTKPDAFNPDYVTRGFLDETHRAWTAMDDVFQMGQLLAMLLVGRPRKQVTVEQLRRLSISAELRAVLRRAIGPRKSRYSDAWEMLRALRGETAAPRATVRSLRGKTVAITGQLGITRHDAEMLVLAAGGRIAARVSRDVDVLVRGTTKKGTRSRELAAAERLIRQGHRIRVIGEAELRALGRTIPGARKKAIRPRR